MGLPSRNLATLLFVSTLAAAPAPAAPMLVLDLDDQGSEITVELGRAQPVKVEVLASDIPPGSDGLGLFGFGFSLLFDATPLAASDPIPDPLWWTAETGFGDHRNDPGDVGLTWNRFDASSGPSGDDILLGTVFLDVSGAPPREYFLDLTYFTTVGENILFDETAPALDSDSAFFGTGGRIIVTPEPATGSLLLAGLGVLAARRRSRATPRRAC